MKTRKATRLEAYKRRLDKSRPTDEKVFAYQHERGEYSAERVGIFVFLLGVFELIEKEYHGYAVINPEALFIGSVAVLGASFVSSNFRRPGIFKKYDALKKQGVDMVAYNGSSREKVAKYSRQSLGLVLSLASIGVASAILPQDNTSTPKYDPLIIGKMVKPDTNDYQAPLDSSSDVIECGVYDFTNKIDKKDYVYPSRPDTFKLAKEGQSHSINFVGVEESLVAPNNSGATTIWENAFVVSVQGSEAYVSNVSQADFKQGDPYDWTVLRPYNDKHLETAWYGPFHKDASNGLYGSLGIENYAIFREGANYYASLSCNTNAIKHITPEQVAENDLL